jgi:hypothetical protein
MISVTPTTNTMNVGWWVRSVPAVTTPGRWSANVPANAMTAMIGMNLPATIANANATLYQVVLPLNPPNALPLLAAELVKAGFD